MDLEEFHQPKPTNRDASRIRHGRVCSVYNYLLIIDLSYSQMKHVAVGTIIEFL